MIDSQTLNSSFTLHGVGLHTGAAVHVTVHPRAAGGLIFRCGETMIPVLAEYVTDTRALHDAGPGRP